MEYDQEYILSQKSVICKSTSGLNEKEKKALAYLLKKADNKTGEELSIQNDNICVQEDKENCPSFASHKGYTSSRKIAALNLNSITDDLSSACECDRSCHTLLNEFQILRQRKLYHLGTMGFDQQTRLLNLYRASIFQEGRSNTLHLVEGQLVCRKFWYDTVLKISKRTYQRIRNIARSGINLIMKGPKLKSKGQKGQIAVGFISNYIHLMGDHSPDSNRILLPMGLSTKDVYDKYKLIHPETLVVSLTQFYHVWKQNFSHVSHQKHCKFTKCHVCMLATHFLQQNLVPEMHDAVIRDRDEHLLRQQTEREAYYVKRASAILHPLEKLSLIADGMDQAKTNIPHFKGWTMPKTFDASNLLQTHITGVLLHGKHTYMFLDLLQWPHDSNLALNCVMWSLALEMQENILPPKLYIQLDNCGRENKNKFFLSMMALLVKLGYVQEINLSFLMVGHTHEDIDSRFSKVSEKLRKSEVKTLPALMSLMDNILLDGEEVRTYLLPGIYNIRDWIGGSINCIHDHSYPHVYKLFCDRPGHVALVYKNWSTDKTWLPLSTDPPLEIFKIDEVTGEQITPIGKPSLIDPDYTRKQDMSTIRKNIIKNESFFTAREHSWWEQFFNNPGTQHQQSFPWFLDILKRGSTVDVQKEIHSGNVTSPLSLTMEKERTFPKVTTGKKRKQIFVTDDQHAKKLQQLPPGINYMVLHRSGGEYGIGKVTHASKESLEIDAYNGQLNGYWDLLKNGCGKTVTLTIKREDVCDGCVFSLTNTQRLPLFIKDKLKFLII